MVCVTPIKRYVVRDLNQFLENISTHDRQTNLEMTETR